VKEAVQPHQTASVLVIAADPNIESLVGELVAFAGHRPIFDVTLGAAGESVRRSRPEVAIIDTALPPTVVRACVDAAGEHGTRVVLMSSTASATELADEAAAEHTLHFALPGGPKQLRDVLERALELKPDAPAMMIPERRVNAHVAGSVHPSLCAALASVARGRLLIARAAGAVEEARSLRQSGRDLLSESRRSRAALRAAVVDYTLQLRSASITEDEAVTQIRDTVSDCASLVGAEAEMDAILYESETWARAVYRAA
jgi:hypothetical protein